MNKPLEADEIEVTEKLENEEPENLEEASEGEEGDNEPETEELKYELVSTGDDGSQPVDQNNLGIRKRINKLNAKVSEAQDGTTQANSELAVERERNTLLRLQLAQQQEKKEAKPSGPPDPLDFDGGATDTKYVEALNGYIGGIVRAETAKHVVAPEPKKNHDLEAAQQRYDENAAALKLPGFNEKEAIAIEIIGKDNVDILVQLTPNAPKIMAKLGENPEKAKRIATLLRGTGLEAAKGIAELGALGASLSVTEVKRNHAPNPDEELEGTTLAQGSSYERKLEKMRVKVASGGATFNQLIEFKRAHQNKG